MDILENGERADQKYGTLRKYITEEMIEALKQGKRLYINVFDEYAIVIKYKKEKRKERGG